MTRIPPTERRAALIRAALQVVSDRGISGATTRAIVAEAGMPLASFHYAFDSRDDLMSELVRHVVDEEELALQPVFAVPGLSVREAIRAGLQSYFEAVRDDPMREKAMFELTQYAMRSPGMESVARRQYARYYELAATAIDAAAEKSGRNWDRPIGEIAALLVALTDGLTLAWLVNRDDAAAARIMDFAADAIASLATPETSARTS